MKKTLKVWSYPAPYPSLPRSSPIVPYLLSSFSSKANVYCPNILGCMGVPWGVVDLPGASLLNTMDFPSPSQYHRSIFSIVVPLP